MDEKKLQLFDELRAQILKCVKCPLYKTRTHAVPGEGSLASKVMFIGEGPGEDEDLQGRPFVGRSGQLLTKIIESVGLKRENVYITNIVKCRPPGNRNPEEIEVVTCCTNYLEAQIALLNPKIIVTVGAISTKWILRDQIGEKEGITKIRGKIYDWRGIKVMPILHPSYLLRNPSTEEGKPKWLTWQDMKVIKEEHDKL